MNPRTEYWGKYLWNKPACLSIRHSKGLLKSFASHFAFEDTCSATSKAGAEIMQNERNRIDTPLDDFLDAQSEISRILPSPHNKTGTQKRLQSGGCNSMSSGIFTSQ